MHFQCKTLYLSQQLSTISTFGTNLYLDHCTECEQDYKIWIEPLHFQCWTMLSQLFLIEFWVKDKVAQTIMGLAHVQYICEKCI